MFLFSTFEFEKQLPLEPTATLTRARSMGSFEEIYPDIRDISENAALKELKEKSEALRKEKDDAILNMQTEIDALRAKLTISEEKNTELNYLNKTLQQENDQYKKDISAKDDKIKNNNITYNDHVSQIAALKKDLAEANTTAKTFTTNVKNLEDTIKTLSSEIETHQKALKGWDQKFNKELELANKASEEKKKEEITNLKNKLAALNDELANLKKELNEIGPRMPIGERIRKDLKQTRDTSEELAQQVQPSAVERAETQSGLMTIEGFMQEVAQSSTINVTPPSNEELIVANELLKHHVSVYKTSLVSIKEELELKDRTLNAIIKYLSQDVDGIKKSCINSKDKQKQIAAAMLKINHTGEITRLIAQNEKGNMTLQRCIEELKVCRTSNEKWAERFKDLEKNFKELQEKLHCTTYVLLDLIQKFMKIDVKEAHVVFADDHLGIINETKNVKFTLRYNDSPSYVFRVRKIIDRVE